MTFLAPLWLSLLLPWALAWVWVGWQGGRRAGVPFLFLWPRERTQAGPRTQLPPVWVMLVLSGLLAMIFAAAGLAMKPGAVDSRITKPSLGDAKIDRFAITPAMPDGPTGIAGFAMVRLSNTTTLSHAILSIDDRPKPIDLPATGQSRDYFFDLPAVGHTVSATLRTADGGAWVDDNNADDTTTLVRTHAPARIDAQTPLSDDLARMTAVYTHRRPPIDGSATVAIVRGDAPAGPAVMLPTELVGRSSPAFEGVMNIDASHPITHAVRFAGIGSAGYSPTPPAGTGWRSLIGPPADDSILTPAVPLLAVRESPARQVWVGFDPAVLAGRADFVVFWTNVFDWLAGGAEQWTSGPVAAAPAVPAVVPPPLRPLSPWLVAGGLVLLAGGLVVRRTTH